MRNLLYVSALVALGGCMNEEKFSEQFADKVCEEWTACDSNFDCTATEDAEEADVDCDFDKSAAKDCLDGTWECTDEGGFKQVTMPDACSKVCTAAGDDTDAATDTDTDPAT